MSPSVTVRLLGTQSDARLIELARGGHERAFEALVQRYRRPLLGYCRRVLLPEARAEDALQQALLQAWLALERGDDVRDARAWLYRIVRNTALNALRTSGYDYAELSEAITGGGAPHEDLDRRIAVREALAGLAALPGHQREALLRTAVEGASHAAAAAEMGVSEDALRGLVHRARVTLRAGLTAITPMPLASWAADALAGHGAVAELAVGGGSAGIAGLLAKGGAAMLAAGVVAAGVGTAAITRHAGSHARSHPVRAAHVVAAVSASRAVAAAGVSSSIPASRAGRRGRPVALAPISLHGALEVPVRPREGGSAGGGGGGTPGPGTSGGGHDHRGVGGTGHGDLQGSGRQSNAGTAPSGNGGDEGGSSGGGSGERGRDGATAGSGSGSGTSGDDDRTSSGDTGSSGSSGSGHGERADSDTSGGDGGFSATGSGTDDGSTSSGSGSTSTDG